MPDHPARGFTVRALGEIAIRCADLDRMVRFYEEVIGLERFTGGAHRAGLVFFRISDGFGGHTSVLGLFQDDAPVRDGEPLRGGARSTLHHLAFSLPHEEQAAVMAWYERHGVGYRIEEFPWAGWRGVFADDPEGNTVELVAFDPALLRAQRPD
jgi:catechol 2,3-dioxygenase-like lactoylglutathione lyase family enzyme